MPRPPRCRRICAAPRCLRFMPERGADSAQPTEAPDEVLLALDEFEAIRLIDLMGLPHLEAAARMDVSRTTVTEIYQSARRKLADCIVNGRPLHIAGGHCWIEPEGCMKGENTMRIAVPCEDGQVFQHFGHTGHFKLYDTEEKAVVGVQLISTGGQGHGALVSLLKSMGVDLLLCGGIGAGAKNALAEAGIRLFAGASGGADDTVSAFLSGTLTLNPNAGCSHHGEHPCGENG